MSIHPNTPQEADVPSSIATLLVIVVPHETSEGYRDEQHHEPEERAVPANARASVRRATVDALATLASRVRDLAVRRQVVPVLACATLGVGVWLSGRHVGQQDTLSIVVPDVVVFAGPQCQWSESDAKE